MFVIWGCGFGRVEEGGWIRKEVREGLAASLVQRERRVHSEPWRLMMPRILSKPSLAISMACSKPVMEEVGFGCFATPTTVQWRQLLG